MFFLYLDNILMKQLTDTYLTMQYNPITQHFPHKQIISENKNSVFAAGADGFGKAVDQ